MTAKALVDTAADWTALSVAMGQTMIPYIAVLSSLLFAVAPLPDIRRIRAAKSTLTLPFGPFFFYLLQSALFLLYALVTSNRLLQTTTTVGTVLGAYYVAIYYTYTLEKRLARWHLLLGALLYVFLLHGAMVKPTHEAKVLIGIPGNIVMVLTAVSPLSKLPDIIRRRDASCLPVGMSIMNVLAGGVWALYGLMLDDMVVVFPNAISTLVGLVQVGLLVKYPPTSKAEHVV
ncbi:hypothetical protein SDRG_07064 [Saprolegnia diclina VS20]|uniref:Sugar transporter SWEET1 n=1 Tax=Saprolegnia diclina (strain VS20) TaxID=1156394 RepID=T0RY92_SAPDV|nr:hypothetical protein SDRG_07064 [Saprolegnia diclina VS20]EQC35352.1 hypothetical protein SDRG_07064 [Saprolegnia diclina VS20]|eukprot:XP_008611102.1 hypothetical protein SDRG_07064 [Saprolegnia diclina VS20]